MAARPGGGALAAERQAAEGRTAALGKVPAIAGSRASPTACSLAGSLRVGIRLRVPFADPAADPVQGSLLWTTASSVNRVGGRQLEPSEGQFQCVELGEDSFRKFRESHCQRTPGPPGRRTPILPAHGQQKSRWADR